MNLRNVYLPPFHAAINAGAATVMSAYEDLNGVPATANASLLPRRSSRRMGLPRLRRQRLYSVHDLTTTATPPTRSTQPSAPSTPASIWR